MTIKNNLEKISAISAAGFIFGSALLYASSVSAKYEGIFSHMGTPMPEITGALVSEDTLSIPGRTATDIMDINRRGYKESETHWKATYHLICDGQIEERPYVIMSVEKLGDVRRDPSRNMKIVLHLDLDRNGEVDPKGVITGDDVNDHDPTTDAPQCPLISNYIK